MMTHEANFLSDQLAKTTVDVHVTKLKMDALAVRVEELEQVVKDIRRHLLFPDAPLGDDSTDEH